MSTERQYEIHRNAVAKGFWDAECDINFILAKLCLIHSEVSEMMEAVRKQQGTAKVLDEAADIIIRLEDLVQGMYEAGWIMDNRLNAAVAAKMDVNAGRKKLHGNLI